MHCAVSFENNTMNFAKCILDKFISPFLVLVGAAGGYFLLTLSCLFYIFLLIRMLDSSLYCSEKKLGFKNFIQTIRRKSSILIRL